MSSEANFGISIPEDADYGGIDISDFARVEFEDREVRYGGQLGTPYRSSVLDYLIGLVDGQFSYDREIDEPIKVEREKSRVFLVPEKDIHGDLNLTLLLEYQQTTNRWRPEINTFVMQYDGRAHTPAEADDPMSSIMVNRINAHLRSLGIMLPDTPLPK